jgi:hypothetical protein
MIGSPRNVVTTSRAAARMGPIPEIKELMNTLIASALIGSKNPRNSTNRFLAHLASFLAHRFESGI